MNIAVMRLHVVLSQFTQTIAGPTPRTGPIAVFELLESRQFLSAGTLRIVTYNIDADTSDFANDNQRAGLETILEGIGAEHLNDNGTSNAQPLDILALQELYNSYGGANAPTLASIVSSLNAHYGAGAYAYDTTTDPTTGGDGGGPSGLIYNTAAVQDLGATIIVQDSSSGAPRAVIQYKLEPVGYSSADVFYLDVSHAKSGTGSSNAQRRQTEAQGIVSNLSSLPANAHVISLGDFNITSGSSEATYTTMVSKFDDVAIPSESWNDSTKAQATAISQWLSESATDVRYRDDIQFVTPSADPASQSTTAGLQYDTGSITVFGNGGSSLLEGNDVSGSNNPGVFPDLNSTQRTAILSALDTTTDHLPVVADYSVVSNPPPQIGSFSVSPNPATSGSDITLTAGNVVATGGTVTAVKFYLESNGNSGLQIGSDTFVGNGTQSGSSWTRDNVSTTGLSAGTYTYYAVATDSNGNSSAASSATVSLTAALPAWLDPSSQATWNAADQTLNVTGPAEIIADPGSDEPVITASGPAAVLTVQPAAGDATIHIGGITLSNGATAYLDTAGGAMTDLVVGTAAGPTPTFSVDAIDASKLDLGINQMDVLYAAGSDPFSTLQGYVLNGQITSSLDDASHAVGYADGADNIVSGISAGDIRFRYTLIGDANLDGSVGFADMVLLAQHYGMSRTTWDTGDFSGDGSTGFADLVSLAQNYGKQLFSTPLNARQAAKAAARDGRTFDKALAKVHS